MVGVGLAVAFGGDGWPPWSAHALHGAESGMVGWLVVLSSSVELLDALAG